jgi:hypothetical protein
MATANYLNNFNGDIRIEHRYGAFFARCEIAEMLGCVVSSNERICWSIPSSSLYYLSHAHTIIGSGKEVTEEQTC